MSQRLMSWYGRCASMLRSLIKNENAVSIQIGYVLNLLVLIIFTGGIITAFYLYADSSSQQAARAGFTDTGSEIARDITNMYLISANSKDNVSINVTRNIPLTIGGKGYSITLNPASQNSLASIDIKEGGFYGYTVRTTLNSIIDPVDAGGVVYSGSGELNIRLEKNTSGTSLWIN
ncbi:MAG: hypothetical protein IBX39_04620 [Candidatus Methanoperedenaceae archaeon]|nr:hypothetical protein [Candidatus Methanoperedenaceae archaeon]